MPSRARTTAGRTFHRHCMTHRNLPRALLHQEYHIHFVSTSPNATIMEQFTVFKTVVESVFFSVVRFCLIFCTLRTTHKEPVKVHDAETGETIRFSIYGNAGPSDNPMQSEICSHIGSKGNYSCRKCEAGGTEKEKETNECFHSLFEVSSPWPHDRFALKYY